MWAQGGVRVLARPVRHEPVTRAVAYRVETPDGAVVISGDTRVCRELEELASDCDVLVHEAFRVDAWVEHTGDPSSRIIGEYHADTVALGAMAARLQPALLMLTHLVPPPRTTEDEEAFRADIRAGGFAGPVVVGRDLVTHTLGADAVDGSTDAAEIPIDRDNAQPQGPDAP